MSELLIEVINAIGSLESENAVGYGLWHLPCPLDYKISELVNLFLQLESSERQQVYGKCSNAFLLLAFSERMAIWGVRTSSETKLFEGLIAHVVEGFSHDYRENLLVLSLLYHSACKIGSDPSGLFEKAATFASPKAADYLRQFAHKPASIRSMGYKEVMTVDGFSYKRSW